MLLLQSGMDRHAAEQVFGDVFRRHITRVTNWCYRLTGDREQAGDLAQEVFLKAFQSLNTFRGTSRLSTWLYVVTRNHCLNTLRRWKNEPVTCAVEIPLDLRGAAGQEIQAALEQKQSFQNIYRQIAAALTPMELRVITLHYAHDISLNTITRQLLLSNRSGAKAYIVSARRKLKLIFQSAPSRKVRDNRDFGLTDPGMAA